MTPLVRDSSSLSVSPGGGGGGPPIGRWARIFSGTTWAAGGWRIGRDCRLLRQRCRRREQEAGGQGEGEARAAGMAGELEHSVSPCVAVSPTPRRRGAVPRRRPVGKAWDRGDQPRMVTTYGCRTPCAVPYRRPRPSARSRPSLAASGDQSSASRDRRPDRLDLVDQHGARASRRRNRGGRAPRPSAGSSRPGPPAAARTPAAA